MKENVIAVKLNSFTKDKVKNLISSAEKNIDNDCNSSLKYLKEAEYYMKHQYSFDDIFNGALVDLFGYGTGCPLLHLIKRGANKTLILFFIKLGVNPSYKSNIDDEFLSFG
ncbi:MAG: hypothetical protein HOM96_02535 [Rickettsiales bacterium]|jgi:hypothetical protein|nr:hypothetical protein [Rickettsiales bacterium]